MSDSSGRAAGCLAGLLTIAVPSAVQIRLWELRPAVHLAVQSDPALAYLRQCFSKNRNTSTLQTELPK
jgi:hypothetical protein